MKESNADRTATGDIEDFTVKSHIISDIRINGMDSRTSVHGQRDCPSPFWIVESSNGWGQRPRRFRPTCHGLISRVPFFPSITGEILTLHGLFFWIFGGAGVVGIIWFFNRSGIWVRVRFFDRELCAGHDLRILIVSPVE
jgi:hypothetical protein